ncbi:MAG: DEAD/DEAH box helicase family protein [Clostridia bacterium]|nr:DEAD/DEAH box helicase family protein [Clostridia bacterium]
MKKGDNLIDALLSADGKLKKGNTNDILKNNAVRLFVPENMADKVFDMPENYKNPYFYLSVDENGEIKNPLNFDEAVNESYYRLGKVDAELISAVMQIELRKTVDLLHGKGYFQDPSAFEECFYKGFCSNEEYLSGNLQQKYKLARIANEKYGGIFRKNISALLSAMPEMVDCDKIYITLGSPFVPSEYVEDFIRFLFRTTFQKNDRNLCKVFYEKAISRWIVLPSPVLARSVMSERIYGTERINMFRLIEKSLNHELVSVYDYAAINGKMKAVFNEKETMIATEKQNTLVSAFESWISSDEKRKEYLEQQYFDKFGCIKDRSYDGSFLKFDDMKGGVTLFPHQINAVARIILSKNALLAHDVGTGKTFVMIAAGHELDRMGVSMRNLYVVPNSIVAQWGEDFKLLYPDDKLLVLEPKDFVPAKRKDVLNDIKSGRYHHLIMGYGSFDIIKSDMEEYMSDIDKKLDTLTSIYNKVAYTQSGDLSRRRKTELDRAIKSYRARRRKAYDAKEKSKENGETFFEELGISCIFLDEAHNYKNIPLYTNLDRIKGINAEGSEKCLSMSIKCDYVRRHGRGVVLATGTPVTNSITDIYAMQKYLDTGLLNDLDIYSFDNWAGMFGKIVSDYEISVDTNRYHISSRFSRFNNLPELSKIINLFTDFHFVNAEGLPELNGYDDIVVKKSKAQKELIDNLSVRVDAVKSGSVSRTEDNLLKITTDGRKIALDPRLVDPESDVGENSKTEVCAKNVFEIWRASNDRTQLIFSDIGTPKSEFNVYHELKNKLVSYGVPDEQIKFVHDAVSDENRNALFEAVRAGKVRILVGSTFKLGTGVNVQDKLIALHHLDVPWRPSDMVQREGRILRQGNTNEKVKIYRYITDGSFDAYSWQLLENKQRFISQLLSGTCKLRSGNEVDGTALSYAEVKALAVGNPLIKERVVLFNEIARLKILQRREEVKKRELEAEIVGLPEEIERLKRRISAARSDERAYKKAEEADIIAKSDLALSIGKAIESTDEGDKPVGQYKGFYIEIPKQTEKRKIRFYAVGKNRYDLSVVGGAISVLGRMDDFFSHLKEDIVVMSDNLSEKERRLADSLSQISSTDKYSSEIEEKEKRLYEIDIQLGLRKIKAMPSGV